MSTRHDLTFSVVGDTAKEIEEYAQERGWAYFGEPIRWWIDATEFVQTFDGTAGKYKAQVTISRETDDK